MQYIVTWSLKASNSESLPLHTCSSTNPTAKWDPVL